MLGLICFLSHAIQDPEHIEANFLRGLERANLGTPALRRGSRESVSYSGWVCNSLIVLRLAARFIACDTSESGASPPGIFPAGG